MTNSKRVITPLPLPRLLLLAVAVGCLCQASPPAVHAQTVDDLRRQVEGYVSEAEEREKNPDSPEMKALNRKVGEFNKEADKNPPKPSVLRRLAGEIEKAANAVGKEGRDAGGDHPNPPAVKGDTATPTGPPQPKTTTDTKQGVDSFDPWAYVPSLYSLMLTALALIALAGLAYAGWSVFRLNLRVGDLETMHGKVVQRFVVLDKTLGEQKAYAQTVESGVTRLRDDMAREIGELQRSYRDIRTGQRPPAAVASDPFAHLDRGPVRDLGPTFPALVSDYLSKVSESKKVEVEADFRTNLFVPAPGGPFVLVQDDDGSGSGIVLPKSRLQKGQEFVSYYKGTYYCDSPSAGEVFVVEPAVVDHTGSGWRLRSPGRLELK